MGLSKTVLARVIGAAFSALPDVLRPSVLGLTGYGVSTGTGFYTGFVNYNFRMRAEAGPDAVENPVLRYNSYIIFGSAPGYTVAPNAFTVKCAVEYDGVNYPVTWGGAATKSLSSAAPVVDADPIAGLTIPAGAEFFVRTNVTVALTTDKIPSGRSRYPNTNAVEQAILGGTNDLTSGTGAMTTAAAGAGAAFNSYNLGPVAVLSMVPASAVSIAFMGDSIPNGFSFDSTDAEGNYGWAARASNVAAKAFVNLTRGSNRSQWSTPTAAPGQYVNCADATHFAWALGTNDMNTGRSLAALQADTLAAFTWARDNSKKIIAYKLLPRTNTSNVPISTAFDPAGTNLRGQYNTWLDTLLSAGTIDYVRDFNPLCELETTGTWADYAAHTPDGTHPKPALYDLMVSQEAAFYATLTA